ncbi:ABC transporter substrate-binding protein [Jiangella ureilytica]|uniref:ABC transporter substrate-binding protein n=1 Tax=Jiangella ureilytica TaxID=2530374 RepID=A0A4R4RT59_9ACTN|nr:ABC transporter substrate-binding protein [Jiangella ureilytica]TDC52776.1 ABC transporter substrate-binding protein [Jiangella ureilytica]
MATVRVGHSSNGAGFAALSMAEEAGCFDRHGVQIVRTELPSTGTAMALAAAGELDVAGASGMAIVRAALAGAEPLIVMSIEASNVFAVMGATGIQTPDDLRGRVVGANGESEQDYLMLRKALVGWGLDPEADVVTEFRGSRGRNWEALIRGEIHAMAATVPLPNLARKLGLPVLRDFSTEHGPYQLGAYVTTRAFASRAPHTLRGFLAALLEGYRLFQSSFEAALPQLRARTKLDDLEVLRQTWELFAHAMNAHEPDPAAIAAVCADVEGVMGLPVDVDPAALVDATFLPG